MTSLRSVVFVFCYTRWNRDLGVDLALKFFELCGLTVGLGGFLGHAADALIRFVRQLFGFKAGLRMELYFKQHARFRLSPPGVYALVLVGRPRIAPFDLDESTSFEPSRVVPYADGVIGL